MKINIRGNKVEVTESIKSYIFEKIGKLDKYFENPDDITATVVIRVRGKEQIVEITIPIKRAVLRCEESTQDLYSSIDFSVDKLERQIRKNKTKLKKNREKYIEISDFNDEIQEDTEDIIVKRKVIEVKPMNDEEAILQMNLSGHTFFVFKDIDDGLTKVAYKRKDGNYGIIEIK
ncbi:MAG: ribosome-associated translation inhibitor RaiA [Clostridium sp.]|nr:ribosome-associated translation inhibitor RaiA [Clostridium sp.]MCM1443912.1 ribosome-associated translation inhibitor RaiA [Candidatus Amulumruptor caecigallinarius]